MNARNYPCTEYATLAKRNNIHFKDKQFKAVVIEVTA